MTYRIIHRTTYKYKYPIAFGNHIACLTPRSWERHRCLWNELRIEPKPATRSERIDYFGNSISLFTVNHPHKQLVVEARSEVTLERGGRSGLPESSPPWEEVAHTVPDGHDSLSAYEFVFPSPRIKISGEFEQYAKKCFTPGRAWGDGLHDLTARIYRDFQFDAKATNVRTSSEEFFRKKRGVCQDFAQLAIGCLRSIGLPARYVSGYLRTYPPPGKPRLVGADASHAWVSAFCPGFGWVDVDPTNNVLAGEGHVTLGWGRDYGDVSPLRGLILGGRDHVLKVSVDVEPLDADGSQ